jgi:hypothetical protein
MLMAKVLRLEECDCPVVYDPVCELPHAYLSECLVSHNCVVLFDEVEKVFSMTVSDSSGVTTSMMTQLLWWLQERTTRVLVLMTTNNRKKIPPELFREGRIDDSFVFDGFSDLEEALAFCGFVLKGFAEVPHGTEALVHQRVAELMSGIAKDGAVVHARLSKVVVDSIKQTSKT